MGHDTGDPCYGDGRLSGAWSRGAGPLSQLKTDLPQNAACPIMRRMSFSPARIPSRRTPSFGWQFPFVTLALLLASGCGPTDNPGTGASDGEEPTEADMTGSGSDPGDEGGGAAASNSTKAADVIAATQQALFTAFQGEWEMRTPNDPSASDALTYTNECSGGGSVRVDYEKFNTETEVDVVHVWMAVTGCIENSITIDGELYGEVATKTDSTDVDLVFSGTPSYSTVGECSWDASGLGRDDMSLTLTSGTVCGVEASTLAPFPAPEEL